MKNIYYKKLILTSITAVAFGILFTNCEREISDAAVEATYPKTADIYTDNPIGLTDVFFHSDNPATGANPEGFNVDKEVAYIGSRSIRIDVPEPNDPKGGYVGGVFIDRGNGRNLTQYDALTFYVKASRTVSSGVIFGFGSNYLATGADVNRYRVSTNDFLLSTNWRKVIIPIPDASKLKQLKGLFLLSAGTQGTAGEGYTFWIDELRFEKLGNTSIVYPYILNGLDNTVSGFIGSNQVISQLGVLYNLANDQNVRVNAASDYFSFTSTNTSVSGPFLKNAAGDVITQVIAQSGSTVIQAQLGSIVAKGSLKINAAGAFPHAPVPTRSATNVISLFSNAYSNRPVRHYNGFFGGSATQGGAGNDPNNVDIQAPFANGTVDNIIHYTQLDFVSIGMYETVNRINVSAMTHLHLDINVREVVNAGNFIRVELHSSQPSGPTTSSGSFTINTATLNNPNTNGWISIDIPLSNFSGFNDRNNLGQLFFVSGAAGGISSLWLDNVYFYAQ